MKSLMPFIAVFSKLAFQQVAGEGQPETPLQNSGRQQSYQEVAK